MEIAHIKKKMKNKYKKQTAAATIIQKAYNINPHLFIQPFMSALSCCSSFFVQKQNNQQ